MSETVNESSAIKMIKVVDWHYFMYSVDVLDLTYLALAFVLIIIDLSC